MLRVAQLGVTTESIEPSQLLEQGIRSRPTSAHEALLEPAAETRGEVMGLAVAFALDGRQVGQEIRRIE